MKQLLKNIQGKTALALSLLFLSIAGVGATEVSLEMFNKMMCFVLAIVGSIGSVKIYRKWKIGASDIQPTAITWFGSFLFLLVGNTLMLSIFGN